MLSSPINGVLLCHRYVFCWLRHVQQTKANPLLTILFLLTTANQPEAAHVCLTTGLTRELKQPAICCVILSNLYNRQVLSTAKFPSKMKFGRVHIIHKSCSHKRETIIDCYNSLWLCSSWLKHEPQCISLTGPIVMAYMKESNVDTNYRPNKCKHCTHTHTHIHTVHYLLSAKQFVGSREPRPINAFSSSSMTWQDFTRGGQPITHDFASSRFDQ